MIYPSFEEAKQILSNGDYRRIPLKTELNADMITPVMAVRRLKKISRHCFMLESAEADKKWGRYTFLGFDPTVEITCQNGVMHIKSGIDVTEEVSHPGDVIRRIIADNKSPVIKDMPTFTGGLVGYFSYDYIKYSEPALVLDADDEESFKDVDLMLFDKVIVFDNYRQKIILIVNVKADDIETSYHKGELENKVLHTYPLAGTRPRGTDDEEDLRLERELLEDEKELAEQELCPDYIFLSPGPKRPENAGVCMEAAKRFAGKVPIMGVCLGHQAICTAFGGEVSYAGHLMHGKTSVAKLDTDSTVFKGMDREIRVARYHSLSAVRDKLPDCLKITAETDDGEIMAVEHRKYPVYGLQFHPESVLTPEGNHGGGSSCRKARKPRGVKQERSRGCSGGSWSQD